MDNIERLEKMKELSKLKAEYHKQNILNVLPWNNVASEQEGTMNKWIKYGEIGYSIYSMFKESRSSETSEESNNVA